MVALCRSRIIIADGHLKFLQMTCVTKGQKNSGPVHYRTEANESKKIIDLLTHFLLHKLILWKEGWSTEKKNSSQTSSLKYMTSVTLAGLQLSPDSLYCDKICTVTLDSIMRT